MYLALYVLEVVDSIDGAGTTIAGHTHSSTASNIVGNLSRDQIIFLCLNMLEVHSRTRDKTCISVFMTADWQMCWSGTFLHLEASSTMAPVSISP